MLPIMLTFMIGLIPLLAVLLLILRYYVRRRGRKLFPELSPSKAGDKKKPFIVGFFHPYCNAGGGGERVLWIAINALQLRYSNVRCVVYTGDVDATRADILKRVHERFNIVLKRTGSTDIQFVFLHYRQLVEASPYPILTLLGQSIGSIFLGFEALWRFIPDIYLDSMGYAFTLPLFKYVGGCKVGCYVHYPTISTDMLQRVSDKSATYNNASFISRSPFLSNLKLLYYKMFAYIYGVAGKRSDFIMVNSTWTHGHITSLWGTEERTNIVYPPCDVKEFLTIPLSESRGDRKYIVSVAQFRPEKDHSLQIKAFAQFLNRLDDKKKHEYKLILIGGCRNSADEVRVDGLKKLCKELKVEKETEFMLNVSFENLKQKLAEATIGLHTMWNEHFGIGVVECMAAGTVVLAHDTGGPKMDIVKDFNGKRTGFLASDVDSYAEAMQKIFSLSEDERNTIRANARESVGRFSNVEFEVGFLSSLEPILDKYE